ncbi:MAG: hypothetical protein ALAOOOJD_01776 [bacterium]|nr:hypothetical protein [bacterium]
MANQKSNSEQKPKIDKTRKALPVEIEEIEIKLNAAEAASAIHQTGPQKMVEESWQYDFAELKLVLQQTRDEVENLKRQIQGTERDFRTELENIKSMQKEAERQQYLREAPIFNLEKNSAPPPTTASPTVKYEATISEKTLTPLASSKLEEKPKPQKHAVAIVAPSVSATAGQKMDQKKEKPFQKVEAQLSMLSLAAPAGFTLQALLRLSGSDAPLLVDTRAPIQVAWYAHKVVGNGSQLLKVMMANLVEKKLEYTICADIPRLPSGLYRLTTVVTFPTARHVSAYCQGAVLQAI